MPRPGTKPEAVDMDTRVVRPAIIWMDVRVGQEASDALATDDKILAVNGAGEGPVLAECMIPRRS